MAFATGCDCQDLGSDRDHNTERPATEDISLLTQDTAENSSGVGSTCLQAANDRILWHSSTRSSSVSLSKTPHAQNSEVSPSSDTELEPMTTSITAKHKNHRTQNGLVQAGLWSRIVADWWLLELVAAFTSISAMASIVGVLLAYDGSPVPSLARGLTLNAVISFLATISRTSMLFCVGTMLSQYKWLWFRRKRNLLDLQLIESASRGPLGSISMLLSLQGSVPLYLAALATISTLGFDPLVQQLLTVRVGNIAVPSNNIIINAALNITHEASAALVSEHTTSLLVATISNDESLDLPRSPLEVNCPSGNCVWPNYRTLDLCSSCADITASSVIRSLNQSSTVYELDNEDKQFSWAIVPRDGSSIGITSSRRKLDTYDSSYGGEFVHKIVWPLNGVDSSYQDVNVTGTTSQTFAGLDQPFLALGLAELSIDNTTLTPVLNRVLECAVTYCVKEYSISMTNNSLSSNVTSIEYTSPDSNPEFWSFKVDGTVFSVDIYDTSPNGTDGAAIVYESSHIGPGIFTLASLVQGQATYGFYTSACHETCDVIYDTTNNYYSSQLWLEMNLVDDFPDLLERTLSILGEILRQNGSLKVKGSAFMIASIISVRWSWIVFPLTIILSGVFAFGLTVWQTKRHKVPLWKSSLLPLIYRHERDSESDIGGEDEVGGDHLQLPALSKVACVSPRDRNRKRSSHPVRNSTLPTGLVSDFEVWAGSSPAVLSRDKSASDVLVLQSTWRE